MSISSSWDLASDAELITAVRSGETAAFGVLWERHSGAARAVAHQYSNSAADADDAVSDAFQRVFSTIQGGGGPDVAFRAYLFTVVRRVAMTRVESGRRVQASDDMAAFEAELDAEESTEAPALAGFERTVVSRAYKSLPERWQAVLWYTEVEEMSPAEIAPVLGLTANGVAALAYRAREGLRQAYLQQHLATPGSEACTIVNSKLGAYVRGGLAKRETALVESHLDECGECRALVLELGDVNHGMRAIIAPLVLGGVAIAVLHGLGFGGAVGAAAGAAAGAGAGAAGGAAAGVGSGGGVGVGSGAGAGTGGAGAGTGAGVGAGSTAGAGVGVGAGATGTGSLVGAGAGLSAAASGAAVVGGVSAVVATQSQSAAAGTGTGGAGGAGTAAAAAGGVTTTAASTAAGGGLAALVGSLPVGVIGLVAAGVVVAGAVGVGGVLGLFSPDEDSPVSQGEIDPDDLVEPTVEPTDEPSDEPSDEPTATDPTNLPDEVVPTTEPVVEPTVPVVVPDEPVTPPTDDPTTPPDDPTPPPPPGPAVIDAPSTDLSGLTLVDGTQGSHVLATVTNTGGTAAAVQTDLLFPVGTNVTVTPAVEPDGGGLAVSAAASGWQCGRVDAADGVLWSCGLDALAPGATSRLVATLTINDPSVDDPRPITVGIRTWSPALGGPPAFTSTSLTLTAPPTHLTVGAVTAPPLVGSLTEVAATTVRIPVANSGRSGLATVDIDGLPAILGTPVPGAGWTCTGDLTCTSQAPIARGASRTLELTLSDSAAVVDVAAVFPVSVTVDGAGTAVDLSVTSAPADYAVELAQVSKSGAKIGTEVTVTNTGRTTGSAVQVTAILPDGLSTSDDGWPACAEALAAGRPGETRACRTVATLAPGASSTLTLQVSAPPGQVETRQLTVQLLVADAAGNDGAGSGTVTVGQRAADLTWVSSVQPIDLVAYQVAHVSTTITNSGELTGSATVAIDVPAGMEAVSATGWTRTGTELHRAVTLAGGASQELVLDLRNVNPGPVATTGDVVVRVAGAGVTKASETHGVTLRPPTPAALAATAPARVTLTQRETSTVTFGVANTGGTAATDVVAYFDLPAGIFFDERVGGTPYECTAGQGSSREVSCAVGELAPQEQVDVGVPMFAQGTPNDGILTMRIEADGGLTATAEPATIVHVVRAGEIAAF